MKKHLLPILFLTLLPITLYATNNNDLLKAHQHILASQHAGNILNYWTKQHLTLPYLFPKEIYNLIITNIKMNPFVHPMILLNYNLLNKKVKNTNQCGTTRRSFSVSNKFCNDFSFNNFIFFNKEDNKLYNLSIQKACISPIMGLPNTIKKTKNIAINEQILYLQDHKLRYFSMNIHDFFVQNILFHGYGHYIEKIIPSQNNTCFFAISPYSIELWKREAYSIAKKSNVNKTINHILCSWDTNCEYIEDAILYDNKLYFLTESPRKNTLAIKTLDTKGKHTVCLTITTNCFSPLHCDMVINKKKLFIMRNVEQQVSIYIYDLNSTKKNPTLTRFKLNDYARSLLISPNNKKLALVKRKKITFYNLDTKKIDHEFLFPGQFCSNVKAWKCYVGITTCIIAAIFENNKLFFYG